MNIPLSDITIPINWRRVDDRAVRALARSIEAVGLLHPVVVTTDHVLVAGLHRIRAHEVLELETIGATVLDVDDLGAKLATLDENLRRNSGTALERGQWLSEAKALYEALNPGARHGGDRSTGQLDHLADRFTSVASETTGDSERTVRRQIATADRLDEHAADAILEAMDEGDDAESKRARKLAESPSDLERLSRLPPDDQARVVREIISGFVSKVSSAAKRISNERRAREAAALNPDMKGLVLSPLSVRDGAATLMHESIHFSTADPPWDYYNNQNGAVADKYHVLSLADIVLDLASVYRPAVDDSYLLVHVTMPFIIPFARAIFEAEQAGKWPWRDVTGGAWGKRVSDSDRRGAGYHLRGDAEIWLLFAKGKPSPVDDNFSNWHCSRRREHSEKDPEWTRAMLRALCPAGGVVADYYAGRAPTMRACRAEGFRYRGYEIDPIRRLEALQALDGYVAAIDIFSHTGVPR